MTATVALQTLVTDWTWNTILLGLGFALYAATVATGISFAFRWYTTRPASGGVAILPAVMLVAVAVGFDGYSTGTFVTGTEIQHHLTGLSLLGVFVLSALAGEGGRRVGDHAACDVFEIDALDVGGELATVIRSAGVSVALETPPEVEDLDGYPPVDAETRRALADRRLLFPRRLSAAELEERLVSRLQEDFAVGHVHAEVSAGSGIERLAVGARPTGVGRTLPPGTVAVAVRGDPSPAASTGDPIEVWTERDGDASLVTTGEFRAAAGDLTTLIVDESDADAVSDDVEYRLVTRPAKAHDRGAFVSVLRTVGETVVAVDVDDALEGEFVGWLPGTVLVLERDDEVLALPEERETLRAGDRAYVLGTPVELEDVGDAAADGSAGEQSTDAGPSVVDGEARSAPQS